MGKSQPTTGRDAPQLLAGPRMHAAKPYLWTTADGKASGTHPFYANWQGGKAGGAMVAGRTGPLSQCGQGQAACMLASSMIGLLWHRHGIWNGLQFGRRADLSIILQ
jgi:hypothetical protein